MASVFVQVNGSFSLILSLSYFFIIFFKLYFNSNKRPVLNRVSATCFAHSSQSIVCKHESGADTAFLIRGDLIQKFSTKVLGNYSKEASFL